jgi:hypothetical protein
MRDPRAVLRQRPTLIDDVLAGASPEALLDVLRDIADTPAPSGASSATRGAVVQDWWRSRGLGGAATYQRNAHDSGCDVLSSGDGGLAILAHLDEVSYLLSEQLDEGLWEVVPYCYHLADKPVLARVVRFLPDGSWHVLCPAEVRQVDTDYHVAHPPEIQLRAGDRVVLTSLLEHDPGTGRVTGSLDNAAGAAAALLASEIMARLGIPFTTYLTDEEEGPSGQSNQTISRGAARVLRHAAPAPLTAVVDIHGLHPDQLARTDTHRRPWGASLAEFSSGGRGSVTRPQLFAALVDAFQPLAERGIAVRPNVGGYVPRSDDVVAMMNSNQVTILGYPGVNRHFDHGLPTANLHDLVTLARALVVLGAMVAPA